MPVSNNQPPDWEAELRLRFGIGAASPLISGGVRVTIGPVTTTEQWQEHMRFLANFCLERGLILQRAYGNTSGAIANVPIVVNPQRGTTITVRLPIMFCVSETPVREAAGVPYDLESGSYSYWTQDPVEFAQLMAEPAPGAMFFGAEGELGVTLCTWCTTADAQYVPEDGRGNGDAACTFCARRCSECEVPLTPRFNVCEECAGGERINCYECGATVLLDETVYVDWFGGDCCESCAERIGDCLDCGVETPYLTDGICEGCLERESERERIRASIANGETESFDDAEKDADDLLVLAIPGRENIRRCGIEIEGGGRGRDLARALYSAGFAQYDRQLGHHHTTGYGDQATHWSVENDSTVDWELVSPPLNIADREHIRSLRGVLQIVRSQLKEGNIALDLRCGLHIHVGAEKVGITHAWHLGQVWGYLEDVIFRLGAAKWPMHRAVRNGLRYCQPSPKGAKTKLEFGVQLDNDGASRYNALSFANYIAGFTRNCTCGAVRYDSWDECTCSLGKCTFEFRVFNSSANMHKIHAYLALCQALVAWATGRDHIDVEALPAMEFIPSMVNSLTPTVKDKMLDAWKERLDFIFTELPLTEGEKLDLLYCVKNSELNELGDEFINTLSTTTQEVAIA